MSNNTNISTAVINDYSDADSKLRFETVIMPELENRPNAAYVILNGCSNEDAAAIEQATKVAKPEPQKRGLKFIIIDDKKCLLIISALSPRGQMIFSTCGQINDISVMVPCTITEWSQKIITAIEAVRANIDITEEEVEELIK